MNDKQSTIVGLKEQDCPGGGWNGCAEVRVTVADCLKNGVCGCIYGDAVQHLQSLSTERDQLREILRQDGANRYWEGRWRDEAAENEVLRAALWPFAMKALHGATICADDFRRAGEAMPHAPDHQKGAA